MGNPENAAESDDAGKTNVKTNDDYQARKTAGQCTYRGCPESSCDDCQLCHQHRESANERVRRSLRARNRRLRAAGLCPRCGVVETGDYMCPVCRVKNGRTARARRGEQNNEQNNTGGVKEWDNSPTNAGRARWRGGKRGAPGVDAQDAMERKIIRSGVTRYLEAMEYLLTDAGKQAPKEDREATRTEALAQLAMAVRAADDVLDRNKYEQRRAAQAAKVSAARARVYAQSKR